MTHQIPLAPSGARVYSKPIDFHSLGSMNVECPNCHALHFLAEKLFHSCNTSPTFGVFCLQGKVHLPPLPLFPQELIDLYTNPSDQLSFHANIH